MSAPFRIYLLLCFAALFQYGCRKNPIPSGGNNNGWTAESHGDVPHNYEVVFPQESVNQIEIVLGDSGWNAIKANMKSLYGYEFGSGTGGGPPGSFPTTEPDYVRAVVKFNGKTWNDVGFRLKGNSTLTQTWRSGIYKLPFRLNFDKFEDLVPSILNQKFYGFKDLSFSPGVKDNSLIREKIASDIFRNAGIVSPWTAFYRVSIDFGAGLKYCGIYCAVELPEDNACLSQFGEESGNLYKPESKLSSFLQSEFEKKNNEILGDYSDVKQFVVALNAGTYTTNRSLWRTNLENAFHVDYFLKWLALNNTMVNWDTYGAMAHNYYLYNHSKNKLTWMPWDNNEALSRNPGIIGSSGGGPVPPSGLSLTMNEVGTTWPLIYRIANDSVYFNRYKNHMKSVKSTTYNETFVPGLIDKYFDMITPFVTGSSGEVAPYSHLSNQQLFINERAAMKAQVANRISLTSTFLQ